jgi:hypothetical protein
VIDEETRFDADADGRLDEWLSKFLAAEDQREVTPGDRDPGTWVEIRLFISSTFVDTQAERDVIVKRVIPAVNRKLAPNYIRIVPVDLRWGILAEEAKDCKSIQKTCLNQVNSMIRGTMFQKYYY